MAEKKIKLKRKGGGDPLHVWGFGLVENGQVIEVPEAEVPGILSCGEFEVAKSSGTSKTKTKQDKE